ncbi:hypothetical protein JXJ21_17290 [candidate division KSB1 bacterium]|nr:hypothetical protein [candidate division KSB1 bacterium]
MLKSKQLLLLMALMACWFGPRWASSQSTSEAELPLPDPADCPPQPKIIGTISIIRDDIFDTTRKEYSGFPFPLLNKLHLKSKQHVIKRELLFRTGEVYDRRLIEETERNLRALPYLGDVSISGQHTTGDTVNLIVRTSEQWTTVIGTKYVIESDVPNYGIRLEEHNFGGYGQQVRISYAMIDGREQREFHLAENRLANTRLQLRYDYKLYEYGTFQGAMFGRPFFSERSKWAFQIAGDQYTGQRFQYENSHIVSSIYSHDLILKSHLSRLLDAKGHSRLSIIYFSEKFDSAADCYPLSEFTYQIFRAQIGFAYDVIKLNYLYERYLDNFGRIEDVPLGWGSNLFLGYGPECIGNGASFGYFSAALTNSRFAFKKFYIFMRISGSTYFQRSAIDESVVLYEMKSYFRPRKSLTTVFRFESTMGWRTPENLQLFIDEKRGIRGYPSRFLQGQKRMICNLEQRFYPGLNLYSFGIGGAVFADVGGILERNQPVSAMKPLSSLGFGLRIGNTKAYGSIVHRIDFSFPLNGGFKVMISLGKGHYFSAFNQIRWISAYPSRFGEYE